MRLNNVALCHVHKAILDKLDIEKLMQEFVLRKDNRRSLFWKYFNLMLIIQNVLLLKWFDEWQKSTRSSANGGMADPRKGRGRTLLSLIHVCNTRTNNVMRFDVEFSSQSKDTGITTLCQSAQNQISTTQHFLPK